MGKGLILAKNKKEVPYAKEFYIDNDSYDKIVSLLRLRRWRYPNLWYLLKDEYEDVKLGFYKLDELSKETGMILHKKRLNPKLKKTFSSIKKFTINGKNFSGVEGFYDEVQKVLTKDFKEFGRNLNAFDDVLYGGFGRFNEGEKIILIWKNFHKSEEELSQEFLKNIIDIIKHHKNIKLELRKKHKN